MSQTCIGEPLSWLLLERHNLGETSAEERHRIETHVAACPACRAALSTLVDAPSRRLRPLPERAAPRRFRPVWPAWRWVAVGAAAVAASLLAVVLTTGDATRPGPPPSRVAVKGGHLVVSVVRERLGRVEQDAASFSPGDRLAVRVTCPPGPPVQREVVVFQPDGAAFPLAAGAPLVCGNDVVLDGTFRLTLRAPTWVCVVLSPAPIARERLDALTALPPGAACAVLWPE